jgi:hypothetical protein
MPTLRIRLPPPEKRRLNHSVSALAGCHRSQPQATSTNNVRARLLPALLMPCSIWLSPLAYRVGANPRQPASSRRLAKRRQPNTSLTNASQVAGAQRQPDGLGANHRLSSRSSVASSRV